MAVVNRPDWFRAYRPWRPAMLEETLHGRRPPVGALIGMRDRKPWRVVQVEDLPPESWDKDTESRWVNDGMPLPWERGPYRVRVVPPGEDRGTTYSTVVTHPRHVGWYILPEHYAVCVSCGELAPCREATEAEMSRARVEQAVEAMRVPDGACPACQEPVTSRQRSVTFAGPNLLNPLGADGVVFHTRQRCQAGAAAYEEKWVAADPSRPRSLLTLRCRWGTVVVHGDGSGECVGGEDCPTVYAHHKRVMACYMQSHGCGRGCAREGHPGIALASGLAPGGYFPA